MLRTLSVKKYRRKLIEKQNGVCPVCNDATRPLDDKAQVDHIISVKTFADDLTIPLTEAYLRCHAPDNLRAVHRECNNARNRNAQVLKA